MVPSEFDLVKDNIIIDVPGIYLRLGEGRLENTDVAKEACYDMGTNFWPNGQLDWPSFLTLLGLKYRFGDKPLKLYVVCFQNKTAAMKGLTHYRWNIPIHIKPY